MVAWKAAWKATRFEIVQGVFSRRGVQRLVWGCSGVEGEVGRAEVEVKRARSAVVRRRCMSFGAGGACEIRVGVRGMGLLWSCGVGVAGGICWNVGTVSLM